MQQKQWQLEYIKTYDVNYKQTNEQTFTGGRTILHCVISDNDIILSLFNITTGELSTVKR